MTTTVQAEATKLGATAIDRAKRKMDVWNFSMCLSFVVQYMCFIAELPCRF